MEPVTIPSCYRGYVPDDLPLEDERYFKAIPIFATADPPEIVAIRQAMKIKARERGENQPTKGQEHGTTT